MSENQQPTVAAVGEDGRLRVAAEAGPEAEESTPETDANERRSKNRSNLKRVGAIHGVTVVAALTLFGAAHTWAAASGWLLASAVGIAAAFFAGSIVSSIVHEWGHYTGAVLSGSTHTVAKKPIRYFFMFSFDMQANSARQAIWMSWGGLAGSWLLVAIIAAMVPMDSWQSAVLLATVLGQAVNASVFEVPIILRTRDSGEFELALTERLEAPGLARMPGLIAGLLALAVLT